MTPKLPRHTIKADARALDALRDAEPAPFWLDSPEAPAPRAALTGADHCDLAIVGAGFTGLWAALQAKQRDPGADVVVLDAGLIGGQASGRNGGICMASLTHGVAQGAELFPGEEARLIELGMENFAAIEKSILDLSIDCGWERTGELDIASATWQVENLREERGHYARVGLGHEWLDRDELQADIHSPTYQAGLWHHDAAIVDPARLAWGLARACAGLGVRFYERTPVTPRRAGHQRLPALAAASAPARRAGLRLRAHDRAAHAAAA
jgi:glycine/D-amino acid oxidase-like deaminating enzyme